MQPLFEDYYLLAVNKPAGLSSENGDQRHPSAERDALFYLTQQLNEKSTSTRLKVTPFLRTVHRLDRPVSGVLLMAKTKMAMLDLMQQFEARTAEKIYFAVTARRPEADSGVLQDWLSKDETSRKAQLFKNEKKNRQFAELSYRVIKPIGQGALLEIRPKTGRFHQIRAQLAQLGCPIVGDTLYGGPAWLEHQIKLHAASLQFTHPKSKESMLIEAPLPESWGLGEEGQLVRQF